MAERSSLAPAPPGLGGALRNAPAFLGLQLGVQALGFLGGLALVWSLPRERFATLALAFAGQLFVQNLAEAGTGAALASLGGSQVSFPIRFGEIVAAVVAARRRIAAVASLALAPIVGLLLLRSGMNAVEIAIALLLWAGSNLTQAKLDAGARAAQIAARPFVAQRAELVGNSVRLAGWIGAGLLPSWPLPALSVHAVLGFHWLAFFVQTRLLDRSDPRTTINAQDAAQIWRLFRAQFVANFLFGLQGVAGLALLGIGPSPAQAADLAALARLGIPFTLFNSLLAALVVPVAARAAADTLARTLGLITLGALLAAAVIAGAGALASGVLVLFLGPAYARLESEIPLFYLTLAVSSWVGLLWALNCARGQVRGSWVYPASMIAAQAAYACSRPIETVHDALGFTLAGWIPGLLVNGWTLWRTARTAERGTG